MSTGFLSQRWTDLTGKHVGEFYVSELTGRNSFRGGAPVWRVVCRRCSHPQTYQHEELQVLLAAGPTVKLYCANHACALSADHYQAEPTLSQLIRNEQREAELAAQAAAANQAKLEREAAEKQAKEAAEEARLAPLRDEYRRYASHCLFNWNRDRADLPGFEQWCRILPDARARVMARIEAEITEGTNA